MHDKRVGPTVPNSHIQPEITYTKRVRRIKMWWRKNVARSNCAAMLRKIEYLLAASHHGR